MRNSSSEFIIVNNELGSSGQFMKLARNGQLMMVSKAIQHRSRLAKALVEIEGQLSACNDQASLAELAIWGLQRKRDFELNLRKLVASLETRKCQLLAEMHQIDQQLAQDHPSVEWTIYPTPLTSLVPRRVGKSDPYVVERNEVIDEHLSLSTEEICRLLDQHFARDGQVSDWIPKNWARDYEVDTFRDAYRHPQCRNLVHKLISVRRHVGGYPKT
jgi:hypothetical protein